MRDRLQKFSENLLSAIFGGFLLENGVVEPKENVALPIEFFFGWGDLGNSPFISFPGPINILRSFLKPSQIEPSIVVKRFFFD